MRLCHPQYQDGHMLGEFSIRHPVKDITLKKSPCSVGCKYVITRVIKQTP